LVNPFIPTELEGQASMYPVLQLFDQEVLTPLGLPGTMMTNAGDLTWAMEFHPQKLFSGIESARQASISLPDPEVKPRPAAVVRPFRLGIITGNGPESGRLLWSLANTRIHELLGREDRGDTSLPNVRVSSLPMLGQTMELGTRSRFVWPPLRDEIVKMCSSGVTTLALACNTTHYFTDEIREICAKYGTEFISMPEVVASYLRDNGIESVALVGIRYVTDLGHWSAYGPALGDFTVEVPSESTLDAIDKLAYQVKSDGPSRDALAELRGIVTRDVVSTHVIVALTELSILLQTQKSPGRSGKVLIDPLSLYADAIAGRFLGVSPTPTVVQRPGKAVA
jgi:aspartate/glutamate racemase